MHKELHKQKRLVCPHLQLNIFKKIRFNWAREKLDFFKVPELVMLCTEAALYSLWLYNTKSAIVPGEVIEGIEAGNKNYKSLVGKPYKVERNRYVHLAEKTIKKGQDSSLQISEGLS